LEFKSPLGEVVKETLGNVAKLAQALVMFQSPLGEVVKETIQDVCVDILIRRFQSPLGEVVKETPSGQM